MMFYKCYYTGQETEVWLDMSYDLKYIDKADHDRLIADDIEIEKMLNSMINNPEKFCFSS